MDVGSVAPPAPVTRGWRPERCDRIALVLQGGGALGAYQAGVYQALHEADIRPDWVSGVSIGAINSALIAGNPPERRLERMREFWRRITDRRIWAFTPDGDDFRRLRNFHSAMVTMLLGQPGFFRPNQMNAWASPRGAGTATCFYDTSPLRQTLLELVDFDLINSGQTRFAVGAVNVISGNFLWFDNAETTIVPEHVMASGALPPALPAVRVGTDYFWDGGIVSNTPLQHILDADDHINTLIFQVDLFSSRGVMPRDMEDVMGRHKDIQYSSRTRYNTDLYRRLHTWKLACRNALEKVPDDQLDADQRRLKAQLHDLPEILILQLIYQQKAYEGHSKDHEFSATSMHEHWESGHEDTARTLRRRSWLQMPDENHGIIAHDVHRAEG
jgi:NTE family protein